MSILSEQYEHKTMSQNPDHDLLAAYLNRNFPGGNYHAVYEAGFSGFGSCRKLNQLGINWLKGLAIDRLSLRNETSKPWKIGWGIKRYFVTAAPVKRKTATRRLRPFLFKMKNTLRLNSDC